MLRLAEFILGLFSLIEAEGKLLRLHITRLTASLSLLVIGFICAAVALGFLAAALYETLRLYFSSPLAFLLMGCALGVLSAIIIGSALKCQPSKKRKKPASKT